MPFAGPGFSEGQQQDVVSAEDTLFFARPGLQQRLLKRLRRGQLPVEAELDMHGMTIPVAENELVRFLSHCQDRHVRCARIIHGKGFGSRSGSPVLKNRLNHWLRQHHEVLAFTTTPRDAGGAGAVYVLLRTRR
jgi:DNA-nicking Smr family endonuclease